MGVPLRMWRVFPRACMAVRMFVRMGMSMFMRMLMMPGRFNQGRSGGVSRVLLRPILLARHIFLALDPDVHLGRGNPTAHHSRNLQLRSEAERGHRVLQQARRHSGIYQSAEEHIAADAGKTFEIHAHISWPRFHHREALLPASNLRAAPTLLKSLFLQQVRGRPCIAI